MKIIYTLIILLIMQFGIAQNTASTTFYFIRHAEKMDTSANTDLSAIGMQRAKNWNHIFSDIKFDGVYSTNYKRTIQTATPTAEKNSKTIQIYDPKSFVASSLLQTNTNQNLLIVGHSNTIPKLVNQLLGKTIYEDIEEGTFGNLYIVTISGNSVSHQLLKLP